MSTSGEPRPSSPTFTSLHPWFSSSHYSSFDVTSSSSSFLSWLSRIARYPPLEFLSYVPIGFILPQSIPFEDAVRLQQQCPSFVNGISAALSSLTPVEYGRAFAGLRNNLAALADHLVRAPRADKIMDIVAVALRTMEHGTNGANTPFFPVPPQDLRLEEVVPILQDLLADEWANESDLGPVGSDHGWTDRDQSRGLHELAQVTVARFCQALSVAQHWNSGQVFTVNQRFTIDQWVEAAWSYGNGTQDALMSRFYWEQVSREDWYDNYEGAFPGIFHDLQVIVAPPPPRRHFPANRFCQPVTNAPADVECPICLNEDSISGGDTTFVKTACNHIFHTFCLNYWVNNSVQTRIHDCPYCRTELCRD